MMVGIVAIVVLALLLLSGVVEGHDIAPVLRLLARF
jgi:hypothetical protein